MQHPTSRRRFIGLAGGGAVFATLPLAGCASAYPEAATQPWRAAGAETDLRAITRKAYEIETVSPPAPPWLSSGSSPA